MSENELDLEIWQDGMPVASASGPREAAVKEAQHYAMIYGQDGPVTILEVIRRPYALSPLPTPAEETE